MIHTKILEIRDCGTFIPCIATCLDPSSAYTPDKEFEGESYLIRRVGFGPQSGEIFLARLTDFRGCYDPSAWGVDRRTMPTAHKFIRDNWNNLRSGDVIDVEFILKETKEPKVSERFSSSLWAGVYKT